MPERNTHYHVLETTPRELDEIDRGVLSSLQREARNTTAQEIADTVGISPVPFVIASTSSIRMGSSEDTVPRSTTKRLISSFACSSSVPLRPPNGRS
ncbi:MAG: winged helix-turn-helix transcriptional regulator [Halobacteriota archaeon]